MKITEIEIHAFGKLENRTFTFGNGVNLIQGENETGKTTVLAFIKAMLFGMERGRGRAAGEDEYTRYRPWNHPGVYGGRMDIEVKGKTYRLIRDFSVDGRNLSAFDLATGAQIQNFEETVLSPLGLNESSFRNACLLIPEKGPVTKELAPVLQDKLIHMATGGDKELAVSRAIERLEMRKRRLEREKYAQKLADARQRWTVLQNKEAECQALHEKCKEIEEQLYRGSILAGTQIDEELERASQTSQAAMQLRGMRQAEQGNGMLVGVLYFLLGLGCILLFGMLQLILPFAAAAAVPILIFALALLYGIVRGQKKQQEKNRQKEEREGLLVNRGKLHGRIEELERQMDAEGDPEQECRVLQEQLTKSQEEVEILDTAADLLRQASATVRQEFGMEFVEELSGAMQAITAGSHEKLFLDESLQIRIEENGQIQPVSRFSRGMNEQMKLAMEISAGNVLFSEPMPLFLDDALVYYDEERMPEALKYLCRKQRQVLVCSCTAREAEAMEEAGIAYRYLNLNEELID